ncbi:MAG: RNA polymerase sigma factor [Cytophagaceae bacterium]
MQEALLIFYKQVLNNKFKEEYSVEGFVYTIANNLWINRIKKKKRIVYLENERIPEIADSNVLDELEMEERRQMVNNLFNKLDVKCKTLLTYTIFDNLSMTEVAKKMGFNSPNAATVASFRCKKFLIELARKNKTAQML